MVERDERGEPTGVLRENAAWRFRDLHSLPSLGEMIEASREGLRVAASRGVTAIHDKDGWMGSFEVFQHLHARDELTLRVWQSQPADRLPQLRAVGLRSGFGDDMLRLGYLKLFMDGTLGSATARLLDGSGVELTSRERLEEVVARPPRRAGRWPCMRSATAPTAPRSTPSRRAPDAWRPLGLRQRIEHAQLLDAAELPRFAAVGVAASVQFSHAPSDRDLADRFWEGHQGAYAYGALLEHGARLANGSDAPVEELDPLKRDRGRRAADARRAAAVAPGAGGHGRAGAPRHLHRARLARTRRAAARNARPRHARRPRDPRSRPGRPAAPEELTEVRVLATMVGGSFTYVSDPPFWGISQSS